MAKRLKKMLLLLSILIVWPFQIGHADDNVENEGNLWRELNQTSDKILSYVKEGHLEEAKQLLNNFSDQFLAIRASEYNLSMKELQVITSVYDEVTEATVSVSLSSEARIQKASKLRLLVDVYDSSYEPLWKKTRSSVITPISNMQEALEEDNLDTFKRELNTFIKNYEVVRPAWSVYLPSITYQQIDSQVQYLLHIKRNSQKANDVLQHLKRMENQFNNVYDDVEEDSSDPSLIWVMLTIGGAIILALTYAGWKKYKGEKERQRKLKQKERRLY